jgi:hypothetical protein
VSAFKPLDDRYRRGSDGSGSVAATLVLLRANQQEGSMHIVTVTPPMLALDLLRYFLRLLATPKPEPYVQVLDVGKRETKDLLVRHSLTH